MHILTFVNPFNFLISIPKCVCFLFLVLFSTYHLSFLVKVFSNILDNPFG